MGDEEGSPDSGPDDRDSEPCADISGVVFGNTDTEWATLESSGEVVYRTSSDGRYSLGEASSRDDARDLAEREYERIHCS